MRPQPFFRLLIVTFAALLCILAVACGPEATPTLPPPPAPPEQTSTPIPAVAPPAQPTAAAPAPTQGPGPVPAEGTHVLRIGRGAYPDSLDPQKASYANELEVLQLAYEGLVFLDHTGSIQPASAESWEVSPDGMQITFHLRPDLKRSDGTPITSEDFAYALRRAIDPRVVGKQYTAMLYDIKGARALDALAAQAAGTLDNALVEQLFQEYGVTTPDPQTLVITLEKPASYWTHIAALWLTYPVDRRAVEQDPDGWWINPANHIGNGPFVISSIDEGRKITYTPNPNYWRGTPVLDRIETYYTPDQNVTMQAYLNGELDINANLAAEQLVQVESDPQLSSELLRYPAAVTRAIAFNNSVRPFDDRNVRVAFSQALDREGFVRDVLKGVGQPYTRWIPPGVPGSQPDNPGVPATDPVAAVQTLIQNGYAAPDSTPENPKVDCAKLGEIKLTYPATAVNHARFQYIAGNFVRTFDCPILLDPVDPTVFALLTKDVKTNPQISQQGWAEDFPHPQNWLSTYWVCGAFSKNYGYCNLQLDEILRQADAAPTLEESLTLYQQAEDLLLSDVPAAISNYDEYIYLVKPYVRGPQQNTGPADAAFPGQYGPLWEYNIDLNNVPATYPKE